MRASIFSDKDPLEEYVGNSDLYEITKKDEEYTKKAREQGDPYYKWDTDRMTNLILNAGIEEDGVLVIPYTFISRWLAIQCKFVEEEEFQKLMMDFYEKGISHYDGELYGKKIYIEMQEYGPAPYIYTLYAMYLETKHETLPSFMYGLSGNSDMLFAYRHKLDLKIPDESGIRLVEVTERDDVKKYIGTWISPEEHEELKRQRKKRYEEYLKQKQTKKEG